MTYFTHCQATGKRGEDCWNEPHPASAHGLCEPHWREIVKQWHDEEPSVRIICPHCDVSQFIDPVELGFAVCRYCHKKIGDISFVRELLHKEIVNVPTLPANYETTKPGIVYYMRFGDRVKIGYTTDLRTRSKQIPNDEVAAAEPGNIMDERRRHADFRPELIPGQREWFEMSPRLAFHIANVRDRFGDPFKVTKGVGLGAGRAKA